jgi:uncharacterized protein (DUF488 family)
MIEPEVIFTVGHSNHEMGVFIELLARHGVSAIADVRSMPYSKFTPQFNRDGLMTALRAAHIGYVFMGEELGARRVEAECYVGGKALYGLIGRAARFREGLSRVREGMREHRIALMCAEKDPLTCHRAILICRHLREFGLAISHILEDGGIETHKEMEERLLKLTGVDGEDLFTGRSEAIERAYDIQGDRIAYTSGGSGPRGEEAEVGHEDIYNRVH